MPAFFMEKNQITFDYDATYYKTGSVNESTKSVWILFHGYAQLAEDFAQDFLDLASKATVFIFPQGLSKFYLKGTGKEIGASWMTSHEREQAITHYLRYLDGIYKQEIEKFQSVCFYKHIRILTGWAYRNQMDQSQQY